MKSGKSIRQFELYQTKETEANLSKQQPATSQNSDFHHVTEQSVSTRGQTKIQSGLKKERTTYTKDYLDDLSTLYQTTPFYSYSA
jgi:hypothetical protein